MILGKRLFERLRALLGRHAATRGPVTLDWCGPGCEQHAYCRALEKALAGHCVIVIPGTDPQDGEPMTWTVDRPLTAGQLAYAAHKRRAVRAGFTVAAAATVRHAARADGILQ